MEGPSDSSRKLRRPLTQRSKIHAALLCSYWFLSILRMVSLGLFLEWRIKHPNDDAIWLYNMSVICETWFAFTWLLDQLPKLFPVNRSADLEVLKKSDLPGIDVFVSTADPEKEPPLVTANTILSILAADYPVEKLSCYISDDGGALVTFEAMAKAAKFAKIWVPFCRKHDICPRNPESYFNMKRETSKTKLRQDFVREHRHMKREYDEFKVQINALPCMLQQLSDVCNSEEVSRGINHYKENETESLATWMVIDEANLSPWPGTWMVPAPEHSRGDHASIIQVLLEPPADKLVQGIITDISNRFDFSEVDSRLPMLVYVSREKRPGYDHKKKAGAMNALLRASAIISNGSFVLNLDCDHYIYNSQAIKEGMCFMMDSGGDRICYVQFPQRFEGIDPSDRYANQNTVFFDINMAALDGLQGPVYVGTGCLFRRIALYGFDPPIVGEEKTTQRTENNEDTTNHDILPKLFGHSVSFVDSIPQAKFPSQLLDDLRDVEDRQAHGYMSNISRQPVDATRIAEAIDAITCWYEDKTEWGQKIGWIYGSVTEDVVTGYKMHNRGWQSVYYISERGDAFRGTAPINLTDRLHQVLRWATGSVEIFFSRNNALLASPRMKFLQRVAYINVGLYPFTSIFLIAYCFLPAFSLLSGHFIVKTLNIKFLLYLLVIAITHNMLAWLEIKWAGIKLQDWWRNEQFWLIGGTSSHIVAVLQGLLKVVAGIEISFTLTSKSSGEDENADFADLYTIKWSFLMIPPVTIIMLNLISIAVGVCRAIYGVNPQWGQLLGGMFFSFWVLAHLYPFAKGLMGRHERTPTVVYVWSGLIAISICLLWVVTNRTNNM